MSFKQATFVCDTQLSATNLLEEHPTVEISMESAGQMINAEKKVPPTGR